MGHWYSAEGKPEYTQTAKAGHQRDTTLADARKKNLFKSVTTVLGIPAKPQLIRWMQDQLLNSVLEHGTLPNEQDGTHITEKLWRAKVLDGMNKIGRDSAEIGSRIHDALEKGIQTGNFAMEEYTLPVMKELRKVKEEGQEIVAEASFASKEHRYGGKVDLHSREAFRGEGFILDFKTKNKEEVGEKTAYFENCMQLAAYRIGLGLPKARCYNLYISTVKPGNVYLKEWKEEEIQKAERMFLLLNEYFDLSNGLI